MITKNQGKTTVLEYKSLYEFYEYITQTPLNETFRWQELSSVKTGYKAKEFTGTETYEEATELFKNGWSDMSQKLTQRLKTEEGKMENMVATRNILDVQGFQPVVPLYLNGIPTNMINRKLQPVKQKVITVNKDISYSAWFSTDEIIEQSIKSMMIIKKLEQQNYGCNLNIILGVSELDGSAYLIKIKIKSANERLNVSKLAFPLVHPSMIRRLFFRFVETYPTISRAYRLGYGRPIEESKLKGYCKGEIFLPRKITTDVKDIRSLDDLKNFI